GPRRTAVQLPRLVRHAVLRRLRHRPVVLRRCRTGAALRHTAGWRTRDGGRRQAGDADRLLPLGLPHLGDLRTGRPGAGVLLVPPRPATVDALGALPTDWRA